MDSTETSWYTVYGGWREWRKLYKETNYIYYIATDRFLSDTGPQLT